MSILHRVYRAAATWRQRAPSGPRPATLPAVAFGLALLLLTGLTPATPGAPAAQASAVTAAASAGDYAAQVVYLTNQQRDAQHLLPLRANPNLTTAAVGHSQDMALNDYFSHTTPGAVQFDQRISAAGYTGWNRVAENIAAGYDTPTAAVQGWMNSAGHRANILDPNLREIGVGYVYQADDQGNVKMEGGGAGGPFYHYWTQDFGARNSVYPVIINLEAPTTNQSQVKLAVYGQGWATQMRVSNSPDFAGAAWEPFAAARAWTLAPGNGLRTVYVQLRNGAGQVVSSSDDILAAGMADNLQRRGFLPALLAGAGRAAQ